MNDELHTLSGAYAVHALPYAEWAQFEQHLHACGACAAEERRLRETAARLAEAVAERPPAGLRGRLLDAARRSRHSWDRPEPTRDGPTTWPPSDAPTVRITPAPATLHLPPDPTPAPSPRTPAPPVTPASPGTQAPSSTQAPQAPLVTQAPPGTRVTPGTGMVFGASVPGGAEVVPLRRRARVPTVLAALATAAAVALGVVALDARRDLGDLSARNGELAAVLAAPDATTVRRTVATGGTGTLVISRRVGRMVFTTSGLPELPGAKGYELWLMGPDGPRPAGLLDRRPDGLTSPLVVAPLGRDARVALTIEAATGSRTPTTRPIMLADLPGT
ncbi:anti-sigma factor [Nonomuraea sp. NPDC004297]